MKRKPRKQPRSRKKLDYMKPITLLALGTEDDPCFGKHYSLKAPECARCGDYEACSVISQNRMIEETKDQESKNRFKDIEEAGLITEQDTWIRKKLVSKAKKAEGKWLSIEKLVPIFRKHCNLTKVEDNNLFQRIKAQAQKRKKLIEVKGVKYRYKD